MPLGGGRTAKAGARFEAYAVAVRIAELILNDDPKAWIAVEEPPSSPADDDKIECRYSLTATGPASRLQAKRSAGKWQHWTGNAVSSQLWTGIEAALVAKEPFEVVTGASASNVEWLSSAAKAPLQQFQQAATSSSFAKDAEALRAKVAGPTGDPDADATWSRLASLMSNVGWHVASEAVLRKMLYIQLPTVHQVVGSQDTLEGLEARLLDAASRCDKPRTRNDLVAELCVGSKPANPIGAGTSTPQQTRLMLLQSAMINADPLPRLIGRALVRDAMQSASAQIGPHGFTFEDMAEADSVLVRSAGQQAVAQVSLDIDAAGNARLGIWSSNSMESNHFAVAVADAESLSAAAAEALSWFHDQCHSPGI